MNNKILVIAEVAQAHDGSIQKAHDFIDAIARTGADAVKFQTHIASAESTLAEPWRINPGGRDKTRYDYWKRMEFSQDQWRELKMRAEEKGLKFLSSPFSIEAVELLEKVGIYAWKIASGEVTNGPMFERILSTKLPVLLSTGVSNLKEIDEAVSRMKENRVPFTVFQCTSIYPAPAEKLGLNMIPFYRRRYTCPVGLSDHSGTIYAGLAAASIGIEALEVHTLLRHEPANPDSPSSITMAQLSELVEGVRFIEKARANSVDKDELAKELGPLRDIFTKSVVARIDLPAGTVLKEEDLTLKKPGTGMPPLRIRELFGKRLKRLILKDEIVKMEDVE